MSILVPHHPQVTDLQKLRCFEELSEENTNNVRADIIGRWLSVYLLATKQPDKNPYNYVSNSPISRVDPDGNTDFYYKAIVDGKEVMKFLGRNTELNGTIAVVTDKNVINKLLKNTDSYINPSPDSYFELPSYSNRQEIKKEVISHYGTGFNNMIFSMKKKYL